MNISTICVCGSGTMGTGIAQVAALAGFKTIVYDTASASLLKSEYALKQIISRLIDKNKITVEHAEKTLSLLSFTDKLNDCVADVMIEAIIEKKEAKVNLFNALADINNKETIFATNTSSLSVTDIATAVYNPARVIGMHFFNPAPLMKLVEVVQTKLSDPEKVKAIYELAVSMGKTPVVCNDVPGFIVNRVARHYYLEALTLVENNHATPEQIDALMENFGFKMGPFKLMDLIGMDINFSVSNIVWEALGKPLRLKPSSLQKSKVDNGELGRKTGKGFYDYTK